MRIDTTRMSSEVPPADGADGCSSAVISQIMRLIHGSAPDLLRHPHHLHHLRDGVHAHDVGAAQHGGRHGGGRAPVAIGGAGRPPSAPRRNDLRDGPTSTGRLERRGQLRQARQHTIAVRRPFGKPDARDRR